MMFFVFIPAILAAGIVGVIVYILTTSPPMSFIVGVATFSLGIYLGIQNIKH